MASRQLVRCRISARYARFSRPTSARWSHAGYSRWSTLPATLGHADEFPGAPGLTCADGSTVSTVDAVVVVPGPGRCHSVATRLRCPYADAGAAHAGEGDCDDGTFARAVRSRRVAGRFVGAGPVCRLSPV